MVTYYLAVTVDVCEHNGLYEPMNDYHINIKDDIDERVSKYAKQDIAPIVELYECNEEERKLINKYRFKEFECNCE